MGATNRRNENDVTFADLIAAGASPRFRTDEMPEGSTCSLVDMIQANAEDETVLRALRTLRVGETFDAGPHGIALTRVS